MTQFVYLYSGGPTAETPEAQEVDAGIRGTWFGALGDSVVAIGNPFAAGRGNRPTVSTQGGASKLSGYSIVEAASLDEAAAKADGCPVVQYGGSVEVYQAVPM